MPNMLKMCCRHSFANYGKRPSSETWSLYYSENILKKITLFLCSGAVGLDNCNSENGSYNKEIVVYYFVSKEYRKKYKTLHRISVSHANYFNTHIRSVPLEWKKHHAY